MRSAAEPHLETAVGGWKEESHATVVTLPTLTLRQAETDPFYLGGDNFLYSEIEALGLSNGDTVTLSLTLTDYSTTIEFTADYSYSSYGPNFSFVGSYEGLTFQLNIYSGESASFPNYVVLIITENSESQNVGSTITNGSITVGEEKLVYHKLDGNYIPVDGSTITLNASDELQGFSGNYNDLSNKPTIPDAVSGTNDGTNWTSLTIGSVTKGIPSGGGGGTTVSGSLNNQGYWEAISIGGTTGYLQDRVYGGTGSGLVVSKTSSGTSLVVNYDNKTLLIPSLGDNYNKLTTAIGG